MSEGKISRLKNWERKILSFSIFIEKKIPKIIPLIVAKKPIVNPVRKNIFLIDLLLKPNVLRIAISLVLFLTGILGILLINSKKVADHFKEQIVMTIYVKDSAKEIELKQLQKTLTLNMATKKVNYVSKEEASKRQFGLRERLSCHKFINFSK